MRRTLTLGMQYLVWDPQTNQEKIGTLTAYNEDEAILLLVGGDKLTVQSNHVLRTSSWTDVLSARLVMPLAADEAEVQENISRVGARAAVDALAAMNAAFLASGLSLEELSEKLGVSLARTEEILHSDGNVRLSTLARVLHVCMAK